MPDRKPQPQRQHDDTPPAFDRRIGASGKVPRSHKRYGGVGAAGGSASLTFHLTEDKTTDPRRWYAREELPYIHYKEARRYAAQAARRLAGDAGRVSHGSAAKRAAAQNAMTKDADAWTYWQRNAAVGRQEMSTQAPFLDTDIWTTPSTFAANMELVLLYRYRDIRVDIRKADPDDVDRIVEACRLAGSRIRQLTIHGVPVTTPQFVALARYFSWGDKPTTQIDRGKVTDTASPEGRRQRSRKAYQASLAGRKLAFANAPATTSKPGEPLHFVGLSKLGSATPAQIKALLASIAADPKHTPAEALESRARAKKSAGAAVVHSGNSSLDGKSLADASKALAHLVQRGQHLLDRLQNTHRTWRGWSQQWHDEQTAALATIRDADIDTANVTRLFEAARQRLVGIQKIAEPLFKKVDDARVRKRMVIIRGEALATFPNGRKVSDAFFGLKIEEIMRLEELYDEVYDADLRSDIESGIYGNARREALAYLRLDLAGAAAVRLESAASYTGLGDDDEDRMFSTLRQLPADVRSKLEQDKEGDYAHSLSTARTALGGRHNQERARFDALLKGDLARADALALMHHLGTDGFGPDPRTWTEDEDAAIKVLRGKSDTHIHNVATIYEKLTKRELSVDYELLAKFQTDEAKALAAGNKYDALAARLQDAAHGIGTKNDVIKEVFEGKSKADRDAISDAFAAKYGTLWGKDNALDNMFASEAEYDWEAAAWRSYRNTGELQPGLGLYIAMRGIGTDKDALYKILQNMKASDRRQVCEEFSNACQKYGDYPKPPSAEKMLSEWLGSDLDGGDLKRAEFLLFGKAETPKQMLEDINRREEYATRDAWGVNLTRSLAGGVNADLHQLKARLEAMVDLKTGKTKVNPETGKPYTTEQVRTIYLAGRGSIDQLAAAKSAIADAIATGAEVTVAAITIAISGTAASPFCVGFFSGLSAIGAKKIIEGNDYGFETIAVDTLKVVITASIGNALRETGKLGQAIVELTDVFGEPIVREAAKDALLGLVQESAKGTIEGLFDEKHWREGVNAWLLDTGKSAVKGGLKGMVEGAASGAAKGAEQRSLGKTRLGRNPGFDAANMEEALTEELVGAGVIGLLGMARDVDKFATNPRETIKMIATTIVTAALEAAKSRRKNRKQMAESISKDAEWLSHNRLLLEGILRQRLGPQDLQTLYSRKTSADTLRKLKEAYERARMKAEVYLAGNPVH